MLILNHKKNYIMITLVRLYSGWITVQTRDSQLSSNPDSL